MGNGATQPLTWSERRIATPRFDLIRAGDDVALRSTLADDVRRGLSRAPRSLPPKHLYDAVGSALFEAICELPEYYLTRAERALLERHADAIVDASGATELVELGSGSAKKTRLLLQAIARRERLPTYVPFDISEDALRAAAPPLLEAIPGLRVRAVLGDFERDLRLAMASAPPPRGKRMFAFLGSTIGNLDEEEAPRLVARVREAMNDGDTFVVGVDLVKSPRVLVAAYDDAARVTARFDKNVLAVIDRELGGDFDLDAWEHEARWNEPRSRIEMHLVAARDQHVRVRAIDLAIDVARGESIHTESSRKFTRTSIEATLARGGMAMEGWYTDGAFAIATATRARYSSAAI